MLFGEDSADEADEGVAAGEDADDVGAAADLAVEPFLVESAWGAVPGLLPARFPRPLAEPDVRVPAHPALHVSMSAGQAADGQGAGMLPRYRYRVTGIVIGSNIFTSPSVGHHPGR